ncbi:MAG: DUF3800 domain-containing protein [Desulfobacteraceae bacterium]|nr:DUF3800 domain-containing protein [Desulfobacteraceae bacterium]
MYLMYVDESGDYGLAGSPTSYLVLTGLIVHELRWKDCSEELLTLRKRFRDNFGLKLREEFHASNLVTRPGSLLRIKRHKRLVMIRQYADALANLRDLAVLNVVVQKSGKSDDYDVFSSAWRALTQRFENTLLCHNFPGPANPDERGLIISDHTDDKKLIRLIREMRHYNPVPHSRAYGSIGYRDMPLKYLLEDPNFRESAHSYYIQSVDLCAYLLYQWINPNNCMRKKGGHAYFKRIEPILCKVAATRDPYGIVWL